MHKTILPLASSHTVPPNHHPQQQQLAHQHPPIAHMTTQGQAPPLVYYNGMPQAGGLYCQQTKMVILVHMSGQVINFAGQYPPSAGTPPMLQVPNQQASPVMSTYYASTQQPYHANTKPANQANQQPQGYYF